MKRNYIEEILFTCWKIVQHKWTVEIVQSNLLGTELKFVFCTALCWYVEQYIASSLLDACQQIHNIGFFSRNYEHKTRWLTFLIIAVNVRMNRVSIQSSNGRPRFALKWKSEQFTSSYIRINKVFGQSINLTLILMRWLLD